MTESVCYYVSAVVRERIEGLVRGSSGGVEYPRAREGVGNVSDKWGASVDRGQRAALTLTYRPPPAHLSNVHRAATLFMIASELKASSRFSTANNNKFFLSRDCEFFTC